MHKSQKSKLKSQKSLLTIHGDWEEGLKVGKLKVESSNLQPSTFNPLTNQTAIPPGVKLSQDGMGALVGCYDDIATSTTSDRFEREFTPSLVVAKWSKR
jgi:hypothetical protein